MSLPPDPQSANPMPFGYGFYSTDGLEVLCSKYGVLASLPSYMAQDEEGHRVAVSPDHQCSGFHKPTSAACTTAQRSLSPCSNHYLGRGSGRSRYALDVDEPWEHAPTQCMTFFNTTTATATATVLEVDSRPNPHVLNWGSDTCFQSKANYTVTDHQLSDEDLLTRLLVNHSWVILHYSDACGQKRPQQQEEKQEQSRSRRHRTSSRDTPVDPATQQVRKKSRQPSQKRHAAHIRSEQVRRDLVKQRFAELKLLVPRLRGQNCPKSEILQIVGDWIQELLKGNAALEAQLAEMDKLPYILVPWDEDPD